MTEPLREPVRGLEPAKQIEFSTNIDTQTARDILGSAEQLCHDNPNQGALVRLPDGSFAVIKYRLDNHPLPGTGESDLTVDEIGGLCWRVYRNRDGSESFMLTATESALRDGQRLATPEEATDLAEKLQGAESNSTVATNDQDPSTTPPK